jgi:bifunctional UDP-N-acetylglucosamine pyrophosphorylase/glucosamine-1-phosphate N-acetyltransferase
MFQREHVNSHADLSILSMWLESPGNYGRILRDSPGAVLGIIEAKDASDRERDIREVNTGIYCVEAEVLRGAIPDIENANVQGEYYLTDLVQTAVQGGWVVQAVTAADSGEFLGVNTQEELAAAETIITRRLQRV